MTDQLFFSGEKLTIIVVTLASIALALGLMLALTARAETGSTGTGKLRLILRNASVPLLAQLLNKGVDLVFAMIVLRALGPQGNGELAFATVVWLYTSTVADFGLTLWTAREVASRPEEEGHLLGNSFLLRCLVTLAIGPLALALIYLYFSSSRLSVEGALAALMFLASLLPSSWASSLTGILNGKEMMVLPALVSVFTNLVKFVVGVAALAMGQGVLSVGVASITASSLGALALHLAYSRKLGPIAPRFHRSVIPAMARDSFPLMVNGLLLNLFFRIDVFILQATWGSQQLGYYDAAYKVINLVALIPAYAVLALLPPLSRYWATDRSRFLNLILLGLRGLAVVSYSVVGTVALLSEPLISLLGGKAFLPESAQVLKILIWFAPLSYVNGLLQYVLIAARRQHVVTVAFATAVVFNFLANLLTVPIYGFRAAATVTVVTEAILLIAYWIPISKILGTMRWLEPPLRPVLPFAAAAAAAIALKGLGYDLWIQTSVGLVTYLVGCLLTGAVLPSELRTLTRSLLSKSESQPR